MDWFKVKTKHILNTELSLLEIGCLIKIEALATHLERVPNEKEIKKEIPEKTLRSIADKLQRQRTDVAEVLQKVCEDVARATQSKRNDTARVQKHRKDKALSEAVTGNVTDADKIREDKNRIDTPISPIKLKWVPPTCSNKFHVEKHIKSLFESGKINRFQMDDSMEEIKYIPQNKFDTNPVEAIEQCEHIMSKYFEKKYIRKD